MNTDVYPNKAKRDELKFKTHICLKAAYSLKRAKTANESINSEPVSFNLADKASKYYQEKFGFSKEVISAEKIKSVTEDDNANEYLRHYNDYNLFLSLYPEWEGIIKCFSNWFINLKDAYPEMILIWFQSIYDQISNNSSNEKIGVLQYTEFLEGPIKNIQKKINISATYIVRTFVFYMQTVEKMEFNNSLTK